MKKTLKKALCLVLSFSITWMPVSWQTAKAEDIDLFVSATGTSINPNILLVIDNSANWASASQKWAGGIKQGESELNALRTVLSEVRDSSSATASKFNMGLALFTEGSGSDLDGAYIRFHIRPMTQYYIDKLIAIIGTSSCTDGNESVVPVAGDATATALGNSTIPRCIMKNFNGQEKVGTAKIDYTAGLFEVYKYFGSYSDVARATLNQPGAPVTGAASPHTFVAADGGTSKRRAGTVGTTDGNFDREKYDVHAYTSTARTAYNSPISSSNSCAKNYVIFIGNGFPSAEPTAWDTELFTNVNQSSSQLAMPQFTSTSTPAVDTYTSDSTCETQTACQTRAATTFPGYTSYACSGGVAGGNTATITSCVTNNAATCTAQGNALLPGFAPYTCSGGATTANVDTTGCSTLANCATAANASAVGLGTGWNTFSCGNGKGGGGCGTDERLERNLVASCSTGSIRGQTVIGSGGAAACTGTSRQNWTITATGATVSNVVATGQFAVPDSSKTRYSDEMAKFLAATDINSATGQQTVQTYAIDVFKDAQDTDQTALLMSMARYGGGKYFQATSEQSIIDALREILIEIQSVNTVFASASLPINATNRSQNENQVFIGMFRPDGGARPRWYGNLKRYQIALFSGEAKLADVTGDEAVGPTGFIGPCAESYWTNDTGTYWSFTQAGVTSFAGICTTSGKSLFSDYPDGSQVEKGAVANILRRGNNPPYTNPTTPLTTAPTPSVVNRTIYTCANANTSAVYSDAAVTCNTGSTAMHTFDNTNITNLNAVGHFVLNYSTQTVNFNVGKVLTGGSSGAKGLIASDNDDGTTGTLILRAVSGAFTGGETIVDNGTVPGVAVVGSFGGSVADNTERDRIINFTKGEDFAADISGGDENENALTTDVRPDVHGDVAHSRPLPVNYGGTTGVIMYYGANDGTFRAVKGAKCTTCTSDDSGKELWAFVAPEHHSRLKRMRDNTPRIRYSGSTDSALATKDYFWDGSAGLYQTFNADNSANTVWVFPSMRRGGRMLYGFDVSNPAAPRMKWRKGCPNNSMVNDNDCTGGMTNIGQTWSIPAVAKIKGYNSGNSPVIIVGGGYDTCDDQDAANNTECTVSGYNPKGSSVFVLDADTGALLKTFDTERSVPGDVTLVDRSFLGFAQHAYVADTGGNLYRIDFVDPGNIATARAAADWTITKIAFTTGGNRKFLFPPAALPLTSKVYLTLGAGDRERPLITNYPYVGNIGNRFYMLQDNFVTTTPTPYPYNLDTQLTDVTSSNTCGTAIAGGDIGWRFDLNNGTGEQTVTSSTIFGGLVFFSTNRPVSSAVSSCTNNLGEARGYAVNLLNGSGAVGTEAICGGNRSGIFLGGGLPPSPVTGTVPIDGKPVTIMIGGIQRSGTSSSPIGAQKVKPSIAQKRTRGYWYKHGDK